MLNVVVHSASVQDRDGAVMLLRKSRRAFPFIERIYADGGYQGPKLAHAIARTGAWRLEIVKRSDAHRFVVLPKRWIVERTFGWLGGYRCLSKDYEYLTATSEAVIHVALIHLMLRRLARP